MIHSLFAKALGLSVSCDAIDVAPKRLDDFVRGSRRNLDGFNVTMPHKETIIPLLDSLDVSAIECGAANTVRNSDGLLKGHATDGSGVLWALQAKFGNTEGKRAVIIGAGGAAKAAANALVGSGADVTVVSRRKIDLPDTTSAYFEQLSDVCEGAEILINATPLGMTGNMEFTDFADFAFLDNTNATVFEFVYNPRETNLLRAAKTRGLQTIDGLSLLIGQAADAFRIFSGLPVPERVASEVYEKIGKNP
jgi:shikimate dehydrogenase